MPMPQDPALSDYARRLLEEQQATASLGRGAAHSAPAGVAPPPDPMTDALNAINRPAPAFSSIAPGGGSLQDVALSKIQDPAAPPAPSVQDAAKAQLQAQAAATTPPPAPKPVPAGGGFKLPYASQAGEHLGAIQDEGQAEGLASFARAEGLQDRANLLAQHQDEAAERLAKREADRARRDQHVDQQMAELDTRISEATSQSYNPGAYLAQPGTMLMNIGAALGGGAAARVTGKNDAQAVLERGIDRDFQVWKANAEGKQEGVRQKANLVSQMRAQYADRDKADLAAEIIHREMATSALEAQAARSKVPEIQAEGMKVAAALREKTATLKDKYNSLAVQAANAAAARRKAEEKEQFDRAMKVAELEIKQSEAASKRLEAEGKGGKEITAQTGKIASELQSAGIPTAEAAALQARESTRKGGTVLNTNPVSNWLATEHPLIFKIAMGDEAAAAHQDFAAFKNAGMKMLSGVAISPSERPGLEQQFQNAQTPEDRIRAINNTLAAIERQKATIMAGATPEAQAAYKQRFEGQAPIVSSEAPRGFRAGVE